MQGRTGKDDLNIRGQELLVLFDFHSFLRSIGDDSNGEGAVNCGDFTWEPSVSLTKKSKSKPTVWGSVYFFGVL